MRIAKFSLMATGVMSGIQGVFSQGMGAQVGRISSIILGGNSTVSVTLGDLKETFLLLCQTTSLPGSPINGTNAFKIAEIEGKTP